MIFNSDFFLLFFPIVFAAHWAVRGARAQNAVLLVAGLIFYGWFDARCLALIVCSVLWTYLFAKLHWNIYLGVGGLVASLGFFKYFNFFLGTTFNIILPLGISFYTFMAVGYLLDVYWKKCEPERNLLTFGTFLTFFPQIVAGPIGRATELLLSYRMERRFDRALAVEGCRQILWGAFAKFVVADNCNLIASTLLSCKLGNAAMIAIGALAYAVQIYCDFSGYSNLAVGIGKLMGIKLKQNFAYPYFASCFGDFWRRWHISLTTWFRDYIYIPLGGSRCSLPRNIVNIWVVFLLSGLWHGAAWTFVVWGGVHAMFLSLERWRKAPRWFMLIGVVAAWLVFQASGFEDVGRYFLTLTSNFSSAVWPRVPASTYGIAFLSAVGLFAVEFKNREVEFGLKCVNLGRAIRWCIYLTLALAVICCSGKADTFIYSKF